MKQVYEYGQRLGTSNLVVWREEFEVDGQPSARQGWLSQHSWLLVVGVVLAFGVWSLWYPWGRDQAIFGCAGRGLLHGQLPYLCGWDLKPPLVYWWYEAAFAMFGVSAWAVHLLDLFWWSATCLLVWRVGAELGGWRAGVAAGITCAVLYYAAGYACWSEPESLAVLPGLLAVWLVWRGKHWSALAAGVCVALCCALKITLGVVGVVCVAWLLWRRRWLSVALLGAGWSLVVGTIVVWFWLAGILPELVYAVWTYTRRYAAAGWPGWSTWWHLLALWFLGQQLLWPVVVCGVGAGCILGILRGRGLARMLAWWCILALVAIAVQGHHFAYHVQALYGPGCVLFGWVALRAWDRLRADRVIGVALMAFVLTSTLTTVCTSYSSVPWLVRSWVAHRPSVFLSHLRCDWCSEWDRVRVARYLDEICPPGASLWVMGFDPEIYLLSHRRCASRYVYDFGLDGPWGCARDRWRCLGDLEGSRPACVIVPCLDDRSGLRVQRSWVAFWRWRALYHFVTRNYVLARRVCGFVVYRRAATAG